MRGPLFYAGFCALLLLLFSYAKLRGLEYWPGVSTSMASSRAGGTSGSSGGRSGGGFFGASSSHK